MLFNVAGLLHSFWLIVSVVEENQDFESFCEKHLKSETEQCGILWTLNGFAFCFFVIDTNTRLSASFLSLMGINAA